tara:strand:- start:7297 stop:7767 length:471 start_codon:yes stop_codon:yes gene_type:complete
MNLFLTAALCLALAGVLLMGRKVRIERTMNKIVAKGLDDLMREARLEIVKNKKLIAKAKDLMENSAPSHHSVNNSDGDPMEDPALLATVVTVLIHKYGTTTLGLKDFEAVGDEAYVSVYVDTASQDLILSLDRNLATDADPMSMINFGNPDDTTYH